MKRCIGLVLANFEERVTWKYFSQGTKAEKFQESRFNKTPCFLNSFLTVLLVAVQDFLLLILSHRKSAFNMYKENSEIKFTLKRKHGLD